MKKRRKIFQRAAALLCCIVLLLSLVAVPASAEDMNIFFDVMDAGLIDVFYTLNNVNNEIVIDFGSTRYVRYVDFVFSRSGVAPSDISFRSGFDGSEQSLNVISLGSNFFRVYGDISIHSATQYSFVFETTGITNIYPYSCDVSFNIRSGFPDIGRLNVSYWNGSSDRYMDNANSPLYCYFGYPGVTDNSFSWDYAAGVYIENWRKYDYVDVQLLLDGASVSSLACSIDNIFCPFELSYIGDVELWQYHPYEQNGTIYDYAYGEENYLYVNLRVDVRGIDRTINSDLGIMISGQYSMDSSFICLHSVTGFVSSDNSELDTFWVKLKSFFSDLFGKDDPAADAVVQTQEQVDYEVNLQIVQAMDEWDSNIEYAETGFNSGITLVSPSVMWISSLASRVFTNMGDFGSIYILIGLMSVTMLLLSKSGIAAKISNIVGRGSKGGGKSA